MTHQKEPIETKSDDNSSLLAPLKTIQAETTASDPLQALLPEESRYLNHILLDMSAFPISITTRADSRILMVNKSWCEITGYSMEEVIGRKIDDIGIYIEPSDREKIQEMLDRKGEVRNFQGRAPRKGRPPIQFSMWIRKISYKGQECLLTKTAFPNSELEAQAVLQQRDTRFQNILNSINESYYETDLKGDFTFFNDSLADLFSCAAEELMGMNYKIYTSRADALKLKYAYQKIISRQSRIEFVEHGLRRKDGVILQVETSMCLQHNSAGNPTGFYGIIRDRTEQKKAEEAMRRSEEKYRRILKEMEENYYEMDLKGNFTAFNESTCRFHGYPADELMGMNYRRYSSPKQAEIGYGLFNQVYKTGEPLRFYDLEIIQKDGRSRFAEASVYLLKDDQGKPIGFWGISRDRTEQKKAELALQKSEEQYRLLVSNASDAIYITQEGRIKYHNPKTSKITGFIDQELTDMVFMDLVHPQDKALFCEIQQHRLEEGQNPQVFAFRIINHSKEILWVELSTVGIVWQGRPAALNFLRDVTHFKKTEARLQQAQKMEAIGTLAGGIAHDFNNILSAILGFTELALEDIPGDTLVEDNLNEVIIASKRAKELVRQILTFARQSEEKIEPIAVSPIVKEALKLIRSSIPTTIEIESKLESNAIISGNATQMHQIIMNLCTNAAHAMERCGGTLSVAMEDIRVGADPKMTHFDLPQGEYLKLSISDTGCGMVPEVKNAIFEPYFTTKPQGEGTGMGLSVVQGIVENYGGKITVESELNQGSTFTAYLPISGQDVASVPSRSEAPHVSNERILFVDDESSLTKMGSRILERLGYQVTPQTSSLKALELFHASPDEFDLVITDLTMPHMTGDQLAGELMKIKPEIPVIICTGFSKRLNEETAAQIGIKAFITKPLEKNELAKTVRSVLDAAAAGAN